MRSHGLVRALAPAVLAVLAAPALAAEIPYTDAWAPATEAAAEAAAARLGAKRALDIVPTILQIQGLTVGVAGQGSGIVATVQQVRQAMQSLGAQETDLEVRVALPADVLFDFDKSDIRADAASALAQLATVIRAYPSGRVELEGYTDSKGDDAYNQRLSLRRAESVKRWLVEREGIAADRFTTRGAGESRPVASNDTEEGRQKNRRVEAVIHKQ
jgi:outer membrane protein OmpA-like peptidoglycan-associated protein